MTEIQELKNKIAKTEEVIAKKMALADKYYQQGNKFDYESRCYEIKDKTKTLANHIEKLTKLTEKTQKLDYLKSVFGQFMDAVVDKWDAYDIEHIDESVEAYEELSDFDYKVWKGEIKDRPFNINLMRDAIKSKVNPNSIDGYGRPLPVEKIHANNVANIEKLILDLDVRASRIVGNATDYNGLSVEQGNDGFAVINGIVSGDKGKAKVNSIYAGGYNIQRLHIRTLVHAI